MVSRGKVWVALFPLSALAALVALLGLGTASALALQPVSCTVNVAPRAAEAGSSFVFSGSGYDPTTLTLQKNNEPPSVHDLNLGDADPWTVTVRSRVGDEGRWTATFTDATANCQAEAQFRVTLSNTDAVADVSSTPPTHQQPLLLYLAVVAAAITGGAVLGHRIQNAARA
jgi:hypothetical protein